MSEQTVQEKLQVDKLGFRKIRGIRDAILGQRIIIENCLRFKKVVLIASIDIGKAFDNVEWNTMFDILRRVKVDYRDLRIALKLYRNQTALLRRNKLQAKIS